MIIFKSCHQFLVFYLFQGKRNLRVLRAETVDLRSQMILGKKRKCPDMECLSFIILKIGYCFQGTMILSGYFQCLFIKKISSRS